jgi:hypothetical protein
VPNYLFARAIGLDYRQNQTFGSGRGEPERPYRDAFGSIFLGTNGTGAFWTHTSDDIYDGAAQPWTRAFSRWRRLKMSDPVRSFE